MPVCKKCHKSFPNRIKINGREHVVCRRIYCLDCSPFGSKNRQKLNDNERLLICQACGKLYGRSGGYVLSKCGSCQANCKRHNRKEEMIAYKGGKCELCGYSKCKRSMTFHHLDPKNKCFNISGSHCRKWLDVQKELDKCVMVCMNCHMEIEDGIVTLSNLG